MKYLLSMLFFLLVSCGLTTRENIIICAKIELNGVRYCSIPFVEMQANYNNLNDHMVAASGILSVGNDSIVLVDPSTDDYEIPQPYNVVEIRLQQSAVPAAEAYKELKALHGKYVTIFGRFQAKNTSNSEWPNLIAHAIENAQVKESFP